MRNQGKGEKGENIEQEGTERNNSLISPTLYAGGLAYSMHEKGKRRQLDNRKSSVPPPLHPAIWDSYHVCLYVQGTHCPSIRLAKYLTSAAFILQSSKRKRCVVRAISKHRERDVTETAQGNHPPQLLLSFYTCSFVCFLMRYRKSREGEMQQENK